MALGRALLVLLVTRFARRLVRKFACGVMLEGDMKNLARETVSLGSRYPSLDVTMSWACYSRA